MGFSTKPQQVTLLAGERPVGKPVGFYQPLFREVPTMKIHSHIIPYTQLQPVDSAALFFQLPCEKLDFQAPRAESLSEQPGASAEDIEEARLAAQAAEVSAMQAGVLGVGGGGGGGEGGREGGGGESHGQQWVCRRFWLRLDPPTCFVVVVFFPGLSVFKVGAPMLFFLFFFPGVPFLVFPG